MKINIRDAKIEDTRFSYECRSDDEARKNARNTDHINYSDHTNWFKKTIDNELVEFFIGEDSEEKLGVIRFNYRY